jgi:type VI secretion system secreted protein Hcp
LAKKRLFIRKKGRLTMATMYMKVDGIDGNITAKGHEKWIEILDCSFGVGRGISSTSPGNQSDREAGVPSFTEVSVSKLVDETSPKLFLEACIGKAKKVLINFCQTGDTVKNYLEFTLTDVLISGYSFQSESGEGHPTESLTFNFSKIEKKYTPYNDKHEPGSPIPAGYDLIAAQKI